MLRRRRHYRFQDTVAITQHVVIPEAENPITLRRQPPIALDIAGILGVLAAIDLDDKASLMANEIDDEATDQSLPPKAQAVEAMRAQRRPETMFGIGHVAAQRFRACTTYCRHPPVSGDVTPLPDRFAVRPPPQGGRCTTLAAPHVLNPPASVGTSSGLNP
jgi:hypothetical protein